jgi:hypothetical protein
VGASKGTGSLPGKGDRVSHGQYGLGTITEVDVYHTVIDFDEHGVRRFVTGIVVLDRSSTPAPPPRERAPARRARAKTPASGT